MQGGGGCCTIVAYATVYMSLVGGVQMAHGMASTSKHIQRYEACSTKGMLWVTSLQLPHYCVGGMCCGVTTQPCLFEPWGLSPDLTSPPPPPSSFSAWTLLGHYPTPLCLFKPKHPLPTLTALSQEVDVYLHNIVVVHKYICIFCVRIDSGEPKWEKGEQYGWLSTWK